MNFEAIGHLRSANKSQKSSAGRQAELAGSAMDIVELAPDRNFEQALRDLDGFTHVWLLFAFHEAKGWKPMIQPPRGIDRKVGVFASRSPYRPNPIGISLVKLTRIEGRRLWVGDTDLLDGTPILDIKPYVATTDALPEAGLGWMEFLRTPALEIGMTPLVREQLALLKARGFDLESIVRKQLERDPFAKNSKRVRPLGQNRGVFAYRLWRIKFEAKDHVLHIENIDHVFHKDVDDSLKAKLSPFETELYLSFPRV